MNENPNLQPIGAETVSGSPEPAAILQENPTVPSAPFFPSGTREFLFALVSVIISWLLSNSIFYGGFHLGFAIFSGIAIVASVGYLLWRGCKLNVYSGILLGLSLIIAASFARSDDGFVKFIMVCFLILSVNLGLCLMAGQNRRSPSGILSLLDVPRTFFVLGFGKLPESIRGLIWGIRDSGSAGKKGGAIALGLVIAIPLLAIMIPLLVTADAAFDALLQQLPEISFGEIFVTILFGSILACILYTRDAALRHAPKEQPATKQRKGIHALTVNTVLLAVGLVYAVYLLSQLAYFAGGFSGILPKGYSLSEYARRGFFEMAWLCAINLGIMALAVGVVAKKEGAAPLLTRLVCLFIGIVTLFLVVSASAKMFLYIDSLGLTRLRVLTQVIIFFLGFCTILVSIWLFVPKLPYMKVMIVLALVIGAAVSWADVDTVVASYNVNAYQSGKLETVDIDHLKPLGNGAVPYLAELIQDEDATLARDAKTALSLCDYDYEPSEDFRDWNYVNYIADLYLD